MLDIAVARIRTLARPILFDACFWTAFWLVPMLVPFNFKIVLVTASLFITAGLAGLADAVGAGRRYFYLGAGIVLWLGTAMTIALMVTTNIEPNSYTLLTAANYAVGNGHEFTYLVIPPLMYIGLGASLLPFVLLGVCWKHLAWPVARRREMVLAAIFLAVFPLNAAYEAYELHRHGPAKVGNGVYIPTRAANSFQALRQVRWRLPFPFSKFAPLASYARVWQFLELRQAIARHGADALPVLQRRAAPPLTLVVVIGESTSRRHMSLYGYCRPTTPELVALKPQMTVFQDAISEIPLTIFALTNALVVRDAPTARGIADTTAIQIFNAAHFSTYWLSNQFEYGIRIDPLSAIAEQARYRLWAYRKNAKTEAETTDDVLLPALRLALRDKSRDKAIFLHLMGTHYTYADRYPRAFAAMKPTGALGPRAPAQARTIDAYDTAVLYNDHVVGQALRAVAGAGGEAALVYFSDHGEEVFDDIDWSGHRFPAVTRGMAEIPLMVWLSPALRASRPDLAASLDAARNARLDIGAITPLLQHIAGIALAAPRRDPFAPGAAAAPPRLVDGLDYERDHRLGVASLYPPLCPSPR